MLLRVEKTIIVVNYHLSFSYLDIFTEFTELSKTKTVWNIACIWSCDKSSFSFGKLQRTLYSHG